MRPHRDDYVLLLALGALWGASFMLIKVAVGSIPPLTVAAGRIVIGALALLAIKQVRQALMAADSRIWWQLFAMGSVGTVLPFALIGWGETRIDSGLAAILMSAVPFSTFLLAHFLVADEPLTPGKLVGVALGFAGVIVLIGPAALDDMGGAFVGQVAISIATLCYAANSIVARRLQGLRGEAVGGGMLLTAALVGVPASLILDQPWRLSPPLEAVAAVAALGLFCTAIGYLLFFRIIARAGAGFASFNNYLVPLFGVLWGALLLGERPAPNAFLGLGLIVAGIAAPRLLPGRAGGNGTRQGG